jgi:hypothetical protein
MTAPFSGRLVNGWGFGQNMLAQGRDPLADPALLAPFLGQLKGLLGTSVIAVDMTRFLASEMADASGAAAVEQALTAHPTRRAVQAAGDVVRATALEVCLVLPGPAGFAAAVGCPDDEDVMDEVGLSLADFVRMAASAGVPGILLNEPGPDGLDFLGPVFNVAEHNQLDLAIAFERVGGATLPAALKHAFGDGLAHPFLQNGEWQKLPDMAAYEAAYIVIPEDADPDQVQSLLAP